MSKVEITNGWTIKVRESERADLGSLEACVWGCVYKMNCWDYNKSTTSTQNNRNKQTTKKTQESHEQLSLTLPEETKKGSQRKPSHKSRRRGKKLHPRTTLPPRMLTPTSTPSNTSLFITPTSTPARTGTSTRAPTRAHRYRAGT